MELTGRQKRHLRSLGQKLKPAVIVGKGGLTDPILAQLSDQLDHHELIKIKLPPGPERKTVAAEAAQRLSATGAGLVGRTALLYRPNDQLDRDQRVQLPRE